VEPPSELKTIGEGRLVEAHVCRQKKIRVGDTRAMYVSEAVPFCQYDIHRQLTHKLRIYGFNAIFGLKIQFTIGETLMTAVATGTAYFVRGLPAPPALKVFRNMDVLDDEDKQLMDIQRLIMNQSEQNRARIESALEEIKAAEALEELALEQASQPAREGRTSGWSKDSETESSESSVSDTDDRVNGKNLRSSVVVQIDDEQDEDLVLLVDPTFPEGFSYCNTELPPATDQQVLNAYNSQMITIIKQSNIHEASHHPNRQLADIFKGMYQDLQTQVSYFHPRCVVTGINYDIHLPKDSVVEISLTAVAMGQIPTLLEEDLGLANEAVEAFAGPSIPGVPPNRLNFLQSLGLSRMENAFDMSSLRQNTKSSMGDLFEGGSMASLYDDTDIFQIDDEGSIVETNGGEGRLSGVGTGSEAGQMVRAVRPSVFTNNNPHLKGAPQVEITPLSYIPQATVSSFLGRISLHFVKEATVVYDNVTGIDGMGGFTHAFLCEMYAITRAHAAALGGNAALAFSMDQVTVVESIRNQAYALVSLSADIVKMEYDESSPHCQTTFAGRLFGKA
jgi:hypothetical protein